MGHADVQKPPAHRIQIKLTSRTHGAQVLWEKRDNGKERETSQVWQKDDTQTLFAKTTQKLDRLIGLDKVKKLVYEIYALHWINLKRNEWGLKQENQVLHMLFLGNPGTGKTTVARILSEIFKELGILEKGHLVEVERADLVGEYVGHTAQKTREQVKRALGGILFIDEAYSLARGGEKDFGKEAIDTLVKSMEDYKNDFILILAGYSMEMRQFLLSNPGLPSRFPLILEFPDYTVEQLIAIAELMLKEREYSLSEQAKLKLQYDLQNAVQTTGLPSNARTIRNIVEKAIRHQAVRLMRQQKIFLNKEDLMPILPEDLQYDHWFSF